MRNRNILRKLGDFVLGKGFYIVLFLCVATIGMSGYYLIHTMNDPISDVEPAGGNATVVLPDSEANGPDPSGSDSLLEQKPEPVQTNPSTEETEPSVQQPDDPQATQEPAAQTPEEDKPVAIVYTWPVKGEVLRDYSMEALALDPTLGDWRTHEGVDIAATAGVEVLAMGAGTVTEVFDDGLMGTTVVVDHGNGLITTYCNLEPEAAVLSGQTVEVGTVLGRVGDTAIAESGMEPHLHLETSLNGERVDPMEYLPDWS